MKLKLIEHKRILSTAIPAAEDDAPLPSPSDAPIELKRQNLYAAIESAQSFMHANACQDEVMAKLRAFFPAPKYFIEANRQAMGRAGISQLDAFYYSMIPALTRTSLSQQWGLKPRLDTLVRMSRYLRTLFIGVHEERFFLVMLNGQGRLIRSAMLQKGSVDSAPFYLSNLLSTALNEGAKYIVLTHNHPRGTRKPSKEDALCTLRTLNAVAPLNVPLLDHVIVVRDGAVSLRESGIIPEILWTACAPNNHVVRNWLDVELLADEESFQ